MIIKAIENIQEKLLFSKLKLMGKQKKLKKRVLFCYKHFGHDHELYSMIEVLKNNYTNIEFLGFQPEMRPRGNPGLSSKILLNKIAKFKPDLIFTYEKILSQLEISEIVKLGIILVTNTCGVHSLYYGAPPITQPEAIEMLRQHALYLVPHAPHVTKLRQLGINAVEFPFWFDPDWFHPLETGKNCDLLFAGDFSAPLNTNRVDLLTVLAKNFKLSVVSDQVPKFPIAQYFPPTTDPCQLNLFLNQARLVIGSDRLANIQVLNNLPGQITFYDDEFFIRQRTYLAMGSGACFLVEMSPENSNKFIDGEEIILWNGYPDLLNKVEKLLENRGLSEEISRNGAKKALAEHSTTVRVLQLINLIENL